MSWPESPSVLGGPAARHFHTSYTTYATAAIPLCYAALDCRLPASLLPIALIAKLNETFASSDACFVGQKSLRASSTANTPMCQTMQSTSSSYELPRHLPIASVIAVIRCLYQTTLSTRIPAVIAALASYGAASVISPIPRHTLHRDFRGLAQAPQPRPASKSVLGRCCRSTVPST
ncbi:hypothetical protein CGGC5_v015746 [Colletotrichum fructicola Nara gc5]|uniref:Uncharacterized protein n=1 Tax=Colletotrichum fructicola (strain Nara gc5) TaxID=1213859 RepID=A0A7J6IEN2_COLFN|nr:hypothetical protein CGGC5_v015746 [Colletotrichum fructicola Nara gc5]